MVTHPTIGTIRRIASGTIMDIVDIVDIVDIAVDSACTWAVVTSRSATIGDPDRRLTVGLTTEPGFSARSQVFGFAERDFE